MGNKNDSTRISLAAVNNCVGRVFSAGGAKVVRPERNGYTVLAIVACQQCGQEHRLTVVKLGDYLRYPNERLWQCAASACPSRTSAPAKPALESDNLRWIAEKEFRERRQPTGVPVELQKAYTRIYNAFGRDSGGVNEKHPHFITRDQYFAMDAATRAGWDAWAASIPGAFAKKA